MLQTYFSSWNSLMLFFWPIPYIFVQHFSNQAFWIAHPQYRKRSCNVSWISLLFERKKYRYGLTGIMKFLYMRIVWREIKCLNDIVLPNPGTQPDIFLYTSWDKFGIFRLFYKIIQGSMPAWNFNSQIWLFNINHWVFLKRINDPVLQNPIFKIY